MNSPEGPKIPVVKWGERLLIPLENGRFREVTHRLM